MKSAPYNNGISYGPVVNITAFGATELPPHNAIKAVAGASGVFTGTNENGVVVTDYLALGQITPTRYKTITISAAITSFLLLA